MSWQRRINVNTTIKKREPHSTTGIRDLGSWLISDLNVGCLSTEVVLGKTFKAMVGLTNLTPNDITLHFNSGQKIRFRVTDGAGNVVFETPEDTHSAPTDETIAAAKGAYWTDSIQLTPDKFKAGATYVLDGLLVSTTYPGAARISFTVQAEMSARKVDHA